MAATRLLRSDSGCHRVDSGLRFVSFPHFNEEFADAHTSARSFNLEIVCYFGVSRIPTISELSLLRAAFFGVALAMDRSFVLNTRTLVDVFTRKVKPRLVARITGGATDRLLPPGPAASASWQRLAMARIRSSVWWMGGLAAVRPPPPRATRSVAVKLQPLGAAVPQIDLPR